MAKWIKNILLSFCFLAVTVFTFAGCGTGLSAFKDNPTANEVVSGNGSLAVTKGDYLYFVNGFTGYSSVGDTNYDGKITYPALYRIKLDSKGHPVEKEPKYDEDGEEIFDGSNALQNVEIMVQKVVGFEYMGIYIFGDYLYYTSPYNGKDKNLEVLSSQVDFFRIKLNRSGGSELLYTTENAGSSVQYSMIEADNQVHMLILDSQKLVDISYNEANQKAVKVVSDKVTSIAFPQITASNQIVSDFNKDIYYTRNLKEADGTSVTQGNVLCKYNLVERENSDSIFADNNSTITLKKVSEDRLFYEKTDKLETSASFYSVFNYTEIGGASENRICNSYSDYMWTSSGNSTVIVNDASNGSLLLVNYPECPTVTLYDGSATIISVQGDFVYFTDSSDSSIKRINYVQFAKFVKGENTTMPTVQTVNTSGVNVKTGQVNFLCVNNNSIYYLKSYSSGNHYLHMIDLMVVDEERGEFYDHFIGVLQEADYEVEETRTE